MIGQNEAAKELADLARKAKGWKERFPDKLLVGPAGVGKTSLAYEVATRFLELEPILFNGADLRRPDMIIERLVKAGKVDEHELDSAKTVVVEPCVIFIDEVHAIAAPVATALLSALDERRTTTVENTSFSFQQVVFLLATTDPGKLSEAFLSRPTRTELRPYTLEETAGIVWLKAKSILEGTDLSRDTCLEIAARMQCRPRPSVQILNPLVASFYSLAEGEGGGEIPSRVEVAQRMNAADVGNWFVQTLQVDANGIGPQHRDLLSLLSKRGAVSEDEIRRSLGISNKGDFVELVSYLSRLGLIRVGPGGRALTGDGRRYVVEGDRMDLRERIAMKTSV
jgi:Holliday junction resolvasome RuvABC ATP-dependent DNA helicase subunit